MVRKWHSVVVSSDSQSSKEFVASEISRYLHPES